MLSYEHVSEDLVIINNFGLYGQVPEDRYMASLLTTLGPGLRAGNRKMGAPP